MEISAQAFRPSMHDQGSLGTLIQIFRLRSSVHHLPLRHRLPETCALASVRPEADFLSVVLVEVGCVSVGAVFSFD